MNENTHRTIRLPDDRSDFLDWATSEDDGCLSVGGLAIRCGLVGAFGMTKQERQEKRRDTPTPGVGESGRDTPPGP
jgi:hypothetical protein